MAKRVGVLEPEQAQSDSPRLFIKKAYAERLVRQVEAVWIAKGRVIQRLVIRARSFAEELQKACYYQGPLGVGNMMPYSARTDPSKHFHYEIPRANDRGIRRWGFRSAFSKRDEKLKTRIIKVSARPRHNTQMLPTGTLFAAPGLAGSL